MSSDVILKTILPISLKYEDAAQMELQNPSGVKIITANLDFHPFYVYEYAVSVERRDPSGEFHYLKDEGTLVVDAFDGALLSPSTKRNRVLFRLMSFRKDPNLEDNKILERKQIVDDLDHFHPKFNYRISPTADYAINIVKDNVSMKLAHSSVIRYILEENKKEVSYKVTKARVKPVKRNFIVAAKKGEVEFETEYLVYVPIWTFRMRSGDYNYLRRVLASSGIFIKDEIMVCPKHSSRYWTRHKRSLAVCEICGLALCIDHINKIDQSYYCESHLPSTMKLN